MTGKPIRIPKRMIPPVVVLDMGDDRNAEEDYSWAKTGQDRRRAEISITIQQSDDAPELPPRSQPGVQDAEGFPDGLMAVDAAQES